MEEITKTEWNKIKTLIKEKTPYSLYKYFYDNYEKDKEVMLENSFFYYLCYLNKKEFLILIFNNNDIKKSENVSLIKPKVEFENLSKNKILDLIQNQNQKDINKALER